VIARGTAKGVAALAEREALWRGFLLALFCAALLHGTLYAVVVAPFDAPDENAHYEYARLFAELGRPPRAEDRSPEVRAEVERYMRARGVGLERPLPDGQTHLVFSPELGRQPPTYYALAALAYRLTRGQALSTQVVAMRLVSVVLAALVIVLVALAGRAAFPRDPVLWLAAPLVVLFLPGFAFIGAAVNNDILAVLAVSLSLYGLLRWPVARRVGLGLTVAGVALALAAKRTAAAALPVALLVGLLDVVRAGRLRPQRATAVALVALAVVLGGAAVALAFGPTDRPAHWLFSPADAGQLVAEPRSGALALALQPPAEAQAAAVQYLTRENVLRVRGQTVEATVWVRSPDGDSHVTLGVGDGLREVSATATVGPGWQRLRVVRAIAEDAPSVYLKIRVEDAGAAPTVLIDDAWLGLPAVAGGDGANLLRTPDFESRALELRPAAARLLRLVHLEPYVLSVVLDPERYSADALESYAFLLRFTFESFWARFGWLTLPVGQVWYDALLGGCALALAGLAVAALRWWRWPDSRPVAGRTLAVLGLAALATSTMALLPYLAGALPQEWPQGRYLYPAVLPLALLLTLGVRAWLPDRLAAPGLLAVVAGLAAFDTVCLVGHLLPHYYGV
jgi:hypothetical protein